MKYLRKSLAICVVLAMALQFTAVPAGAASAPEWQNVQNTSIQASGNHYSINTERVWALPIGAAITDDPRNMQTGVFYSGDVQNFLCSEESTEVFIEYVPVWILSTADGGNDRYLLNVGVDVKTLMATGAFVTLTGAAISVTNIGTDDDPVISVQYGMTLRIDNGSEVKVYNAGFSISADNADNSAAAAINGVNRNDADKPASVWNDPGAAAVGGKISTDGIVPAAIVPTGADPDDLEGCKTVSTARPQGSDTPLVYRYSSGANGAEIELDYFLVSQCKLSYNGRGNYLASVSPVINKAKAFNSDLTIRGGAVSKYIFSGDKNDPNCAIEYLTELIAETAYCSIYKGYGTVMNGREGFSDISGYNANGESSSYTGDAAAPLSLAVSNKIDVYSTPAAMLPSYAGGLDLEYARITLPPGSSLSYDDGSSSAQAKFIVPFTGKSSYNGHGAYIAYAEGVAMEADAQNADLELYSGAIDSGGYNYGTKVDPIATLAILNEARITVPAGTVLFQYCEIVKGDSSAYYAGGNGFDGSFMTGWGQMELRNQALAESSFGDVAFSVTPAEAMDLSGYLVESESVMSQPLGYQYCGSDVAQLSFNLSWDVVTLNGHGKLINAFSVSQGAFNVSEDLSAVLSGKASSNINTASRTDQVGLRLYNLRLIISNPNEGGRSWLRSFFARVTGQKDIFVILPEGYTSPENFAELKTITFDANGGTGIGYTQTVASGAAAELKPNAFTKDGCSFDGWNTAANGSGDPYTDGQSVTLSDDLTLYAQWAQTPPAAPPAGSASGYVSQESETTAAAVTGGATEYKADPEILKQYVDLDPEAWYADGVSYVIEKGIMKGISDNEFGPNLRTTRAMIATMLWRVEGEPGSSFETNYGDVTDGEWFSEAVRWASEKGLMEGYEDGDFAPDKELSREELVVVLYRLVQSRGGGFTGAWMFPLNFGDASDVSGWANEAMHWAVMNGILIGDENGNLNPQAPATRAEMALIIKRFMEL